MLDLHKDPKKVGIAIQAVCDRYLEELNEILPILQVNPTLTDDALDALITLQRKGCEKIEIID